MTFDILCNAVDLDAIDAAIGEPLARFPDGGGRVRVETPTGEILVVGVGENFYDDGDPDHPDPELVPFKHAVSVEDEHGGGEPLARLVFALVAKTSKAVLVVNYEKIVARAPGPA